MGMWEEASDPVMGKKDKNEERKERILNLTLEIIYLLTGEGYVIPKKKSPTVGLGALHAPGSVIQKENDKKILELISNIIQLLTGETWEYIKGNNPLYKEGIKEEEPQQPRPLDCENKTDETVSFYYENISTKHVDQEEDRILPCPDMSPVQQPPAANGIKEEVASCERGNQSDCRINPLSEQTQGPDTCTPTPVMGSLADNYISNGIKEETVLYEGGSQSDCSIDPFTEQIQGMDMSIAMTRWSLNTNLSGNQITNGIKDEATSWEGGNQSDCSINPLTEQTQGTGTPTPIMGCSLSIGLSLTHDPFICSECGKCFTQSLEPAEQKKHTGGKLFYCYECREQRSALHTEQICRSQNPFSCSECGKCFKDQTHLNVHQKIHTGEKPFSCSECGKCFSRRSHLDVHRTVHTGEKPFCCPECGKRFKRRSHLSVHRAIHTGEKPFACSYCGKCFTDRCHLNLHENVHSGRKPYSCSECGKCFAHSSNLTVHRRIHTGEKPFACGECGKSFAHHSHLNVHRKTHTGEKPFSCSECGKCFQRPSYLSVHRKTHTGEKPFSCLECGKCFTRRCSLIVHQKMHAGEM